MRPLTIDEIIETINIVSLSLEIHGDALSADDRDTVRLLARRSLQYAAESLSARNLEGPVDEQPVRRPTMPPVREGNGG